MPMPFMITFPRDASTTLEQCKLEVQAPLTAKQIQEEQLADQESYIARIRDIERPATRFKIFLKSIVDLSEPPTHEALEVRQWYFLGFITGGVLGGILKNQNAHQEYVRRHNADIFEGKYRANRAYWDTLLQSIFRRGFRYGLVTSTLVGTSSLICYGSIVYRGRIHMPDWILGFGTMGALSRLWIGPRGMVAGGVISSFIGLLSSGIFSSLESASGTSMQQRIYEHHFEWLKQKESLRRELQIRHEREFMDRITNGGRS